MGHGRIIARLFLLGLGVAPGAFPIAQAQSADPAVPEVVVARAEPAEWRQVTLIPATVSAVDRASLASRTGGWVTSVRVEAGADVAEGELLAEVGAVDVRAQVAEAKGRLGAARASYNHALGLEQRYSALERKGVVTKEQYQGMLRNLLAARAELSAATSALAAAKSNVNYGDIRAPFAGIVAQKNVWPGDYAPPGRTLFMIAGKTPEIRTEAGAATFARLKVGEHAEVRVDARALPATITRLVAAADPQTHGYPIELRLADGATAPYGAYAEVQLTLGTEMQLSVPASALIRRAGLLSVFIVDGASRARLRLVRTGARAGGRVAIVAGLAAGERVIVDPPPGLENGTTIRPMVQKKRARATGERDG